MKGKTLRKKIKKSVQRTLSFCFIHEKFFKSLGYISSQNVSYCKLKLNTFSLLLLFVEFSQFLNGETKVSNKIKAVVLTSMNNSICQEQHSYLATLIINELFSVCMLSVFQRA